jgi:Flp pilus assembly protein TadD
MSFNSHIARQLFSCAVVAALISGCGTDEDKTIVKKETPSTAVAQNETTPAPNPVETTEKAASTAKPAVVGEVTYEIAERAFLDGRYDEAVDLFTRYTERKPDNSFGHYMLGLSAWKDGRIDVAEGEFQKSLTLDPNHQKSCLNLARVLLQGHRPTEALTVLERALEIDSTSSAAFRLKGNALGDLGRSDEAVAAYQSAIQLDPEDAWSMNNLAFIEIQQGHYDEALPALARATELRKDVPLFYNNLGMALEHGSHYAAAAEAYGFAVSLDGSNTKAVQNHDRAITVRDDPSIPAVDLTALAREFESSILEGKLAVTTPAKADSVVSVQPR